MLDISNRLGSAHWHRSNATDVFINISQVFFQSNKTNSFRYSENEGILYVIDDYRFEQWITIVTWLGKAYLIPGL
jgi:hypothetical protein